MNTRDIFNNYGNFFQNGSYSNGKPILYKLCFFVAKNGDDFAIFKRDENNYCVGHFCDFDCKNFIVSWCFGYYDFKSFESAKDFIMYQLTE